MPFNCSPAAHNAPLSAGAQPRTSPDGVCAGEALHARDAPAILLCCFQSIEATDGVAHSGVGAAMAAPRYQRQNCRTDDRLSRRGFQARCTAPAARRSWRQQVMTTRTAALQTSHGGGRFSERRADRRSRRRRDAQVWRAAEKHAGDKVTASALAQRRHVAVFPAVYE